MSYFPKNFYFGAATSAHQVEGGTHNDWSEWEIENAKIKNQNATLMDYPDYIVQGYPSPLQKENYISGIACDHYHRYEEDFDIAKQLGHNAHRFSIEWSRVEPEEGKFDEKEIEHYRMVIRALRKRGMEPFVALWHWTVPLWFRDQGGWANAHSIEWFSRYAERMARAFPEAQFWITLNETNVYTSQGYWKGIWPPGIRSIAKYLFANHHLSRAHRRAYEVIKQVNPHAHISIAHNVIYFSRLKNFLKSFVWNHLFVRSIRGYQDFIGVNYYHSDRDTGQSSELNWPVDPEGLYYILKDIARYQQPIYITENGIADARDEKRADFIIQHLQWVKKAIDEGVDVRGYFYWSLLDNFEWDKGFWPRFGLVGVDYHTMERTIRPSAWEYKKIIVQNSDLTKL